MKRGWLCALLIISIVVTFILVVIISAVALNEIAIWHDSKACMKLKSDGADKIYLPSDRCLSSLAIVTGRESICDMVAVPLVRQSCYTLVAEKKNSTSDKK